MIKRRIETFPVVKNGYMYLIVHKYFPVRVERLGVSIKSLIEKTLSLGVDVAHTDSHFLAPIATFGYLKRFSFHHSKKHFYLLNIHFR